MAHNLATVNGQVQMAYQNEQPWHGLGNPMFEMKNSTEALKAAGMDWNVNLEPLVLQSNGMLVPDTFAVVRDADGAILSTVGGDYHPFQNAEAFAILDDACKEFGVTIETAGALGNGSKTWMLATLPTPLTVTKGDTWKGGFLVCGDHTGHRAHVARPTGTRVVCENTMRMAMSSGADFIKVPHTKRGASQLDAARELVTAVTKSLVETNRTFQQMAATVLTAGDVVKFIEEVFPSSETKEDSTRLTNRRAAVAELAFTGVGSELAMQATGGQPNVWSVYNAVTEYFDHVVTGAAKTADAKRRANQSALFGTAASIKFLALQKAMQLVAA